jgi:protein-S-isoprenylcysteine O-methyltransferase Ste14
MLHPNLYAIAVAFWLAVGAVWFAAAFRTKRIARRQASASRILQIVVVVAGYVLLFNRRTHVGPLADPFLPPSQALGYAALVITAFGAAIAIWARLFLGGNWSSSVTIKEGHTLIRSGPYHFVRHPIYFGLFAAAAGVAMLMGDVGALLGCLLTGLSWWLKSSSEEALLMQQFGADYTRYRREVKRMIPFVL